MAFRSILFDDGEDRAATAPMAEPNYFPDLNLDQIVEAITAGREEYDLKPFFRHRLRTVAAIHYRHDVLRDLEAGPALVCINRFAGLMRLVRQKMARAEKLYYRHQKERWFLHAVETYCGAVRELQHEFERLELSSAGCLGFRAFLTDYAASEAFVNLAAAADRLSAELAAIEYLVLIRGGGFRVRRFSGEPDYSAEIADVFSRFRQGAVEDYRVEFRKSLDANTVEAKVLEFVALLHPQIFSCLEQFCARNALYADPTLMRFDREVQFYVAYLEYLGPMERAGLAFCYPRVSDENREVHDQDGFDLALAAKLTSAGAEVVRNSFWLTGKERILVVSGPNQGGKTTFARAFGQMHHLASVGCPVPGTSARLFLFDSLFTHFEREEGRENPEGMLQQDLVRIHEILQNATPRSIVILNEIFSSTTFRDAVFLARKIMAKLIELDLLCVFITFLDELASLSESTVSMVSTVVPENPASRTYRVVRRPADGRSYAISLAEKYRLTYECLNARMR